MYAGHAYSQPLPPALSSSSHGATPSHGKANASQRHPAVKKRRVFYFSGFDPKGPLHYHSLYQSEAHKQAAVSGARIQVGKREKSSPLADSWRIDAEFDGQHTHTVYEFLRWDDIIRRYWPRSEGRILLDLLRTAKLYLGSGTLWRVLATAWPPFVTALYPVLFLLLVLGGGAAAAVAASQALAAFALPAVSCYAGGLLALLATIQAGRWLEQRLNSYWLLRIYAFTARQALNQLPELEARLDAFAGHLVRQLAQAEEDEVLLVAHSTGTLMAISALARALALDSGLAKHGPRVGLLTLGQCIPILSFLPQAQRFRQELAAVAQAQDIAWLDFTAPTDGACFALVDPVAVSGIELPQKPADRPKRLSPRYAKLLQPEHYRKIRRNWHRMHFQYLMSSDLPGDYDYFAITAGPLALDQRFGACPGVQGFTTFQLFR